MWIKTHSYDQISCKTYRSYPVVLNFYSAYLRGFIFNDKNHKLLPNGLLDQYDYQKTDNSCYEMEGMKACIQIFESADILVFTENNGYYIYKRLQRL